jgi:hypothetical protein
LKLRADIQPSNELCRRYTATRRAAAVLPHGHFCEKGVNYGEFPERAVFVG